ncbi:MAG TPA: LptA/OstA family protein [Myxococcota bacterium]|nr:LptA/OstA family protein [Myxococcota bacterium]
MPSAPRTLAASLAGLGFALATAAAQEAAPAPAPAQPAAAAAAVPAVSAPPSRALFDLGWDSGKPLSIRSDELEYSQAEGARRLLFRRNVRVEQDGLTISSDRLEAIYPPKGNQPNRLVAEGDVRLAKGDRVARCARATYDRTSEVLTCEGAAEVQEGQSRLSGDVIEIDLGADRVRVRGAAAVSLEAGLLKEGGPAR